MRDVVHLLSIILFFFGCGVFWKLYFFKPPGRTDVEDRLQEKSHSIANESSSLQATANMIKNRVDNAEDPFRALTEMLVGRRQ